MSTGQTELTRLLSAAIASANPDPLSNPLGVYWGHPASYASGKRQSGLNQTWSVFRNAGSSVELSGSLKGYGLLMRQQNDGFGPDI